jgi:sortase A
MVRRSSFSGKWIWGVAVLAVALIALLGLAGISLLGGPGGPQQALATATPPAVAVVVNAPAPTSPPVLPTNTPQLPTATPQPADTATPQPVAAVAADAMPTPPPGAVVKPSDASPNPAASEAVPVPTATSAPAKPAPAKATPAVPMLPNGVRYGDRKPKIPDRIVRIASPNIKLDTPVYEVYATSKGAWEVAEYAAGHHYNSLNPGQGGNIVLSGHNNWRGEVFRYLEFFKPGDQINVWTLDGKQYKYRVEEVKKLREAGATLAQRLSNGEVMKPTSSEQLTLITCWPYTTFTHRLIVIAKPVGTSQ